MKDIKLIAFDLDGTMLNDKKELTEENRQALLAAAEKGIEIVPATGRLPMALPTAFQALPIHYGIFINGAEVADMRTGESLGQRHFRRPCPIQYRSHISHHLCRQGMVPQKLSHISRLLQQHKQQMHTAHITVSHFSGFLSSLTNELRHRLIVVNIFSPPQADFRRGSKKIYNSL